MPSYKHTQIGYFMLVTTLVVLVFFVQVYMTARAEPPSPDSGTNLLVTAVMALVVIILASFATLTTSVDKNFVRIKFGFGIFRKKIPLTDIASAKAVRNPWYYGWGIHYFYMSGHPKWVYGVSGFGAVEVVIKKGKAYRIGTDEPQKLEQALNNAMNGL